MTDSNYQRWAELVDREAVGGCLSPEEETFCKDYTARNPVCQRELEFFKELANLSKAPDDKTRAIVNNALTFVEREQEQAQQTDEEPPDIQLFVRNRSPHAWLLGGLAAVACALFALLWLNDDKPQQAKPIANIEGSSPRVELVYASGQVRVNDRRVKVGDFLLEEGDLVEVLNGQACLAIDPGIDICQDVNTRLRVQKVSGNARRLELINGRVTASLAPQPKNMTFSVVAKDTVVTAIGTVFSVELSNDQEGIETAVLAGKVTVARKSDNRVVRAHQRATVHNSAARVTSIVRADESQYWALVQHIDLWKGPATSVLDLRSAPTGATVLLNGQSIGAAPLSSLIPAGRHRIALKIGDRTVLDQPFSSEAGQVALKSIDLKSAVRSWLSETDSDLADTQIKPEPKKKASDDYRNRIKWLTQTPAGQLIRVARKYMQQSRWEDAAYAYRELRQTQPQSVEAHTVLVPLGRLELDHLHQPKQALQNFELYLRQGGGSLSQEARFARVKALRQLGKRSEEIDAVEEFLERYPSSFESKILRRRLETLTGKKEQISTD